MNEMMNIEMNLPQKIYHDIAKLSEETQNALMKCDKAINTWNRSHSNNTWKAITIGGEHMPLRRLRQIAAEISRKKDAMTEAKFAWLKRVQLSEVYKEKAEDEKSPAKKKYLEIKAQEQKELAECLHRPYIGAMKDVIELSKLHDSIIEQVTKEYGKFDEEIFEMEEAKYWVKRSFAQSLRDIRAIGKISKGEQELLEQIGLDPVVVTQILSVFLNKQIKVVVDNVNNLDSKVKSESLDNFLDECAEKFYQASYEKMKRIGFSELIDRETLLIDEGEK